jgi:hypothetical protein
MTTSAATLIEESWFGVVQTPKDAYVLLEACRTGVLQRITRRFASFFLKVASSPDRNVSHVPFHPSSASQTMNARLSSVLVLYSSGKNEKLASNAGLTMSGGVVSKKNLLKNSPPSAVIDNSKQPVEFLVLFSFILN